MGRHWVGLDGDQLMDIKDEVAVTLSESLGVRTTWMTSKR